MSDVMRPETATAAAPAGSRESARAAFIRRATGGGLTQTEIAGELGISPTTVARIASSHGIALTGNRRASWSPERDARLAELAAAGLSAVRIADALGGVSRNAVIGRMRRLGVALSRARTEPAAGSERTPKLAWTAADDAVVEAMSRAGDPVAAIAAATQRTAAAVRTRLRDLGLRRPGRRATKPSSPAQPEQKPPARRPPAEEASARPRPHGPRVCPERARRRAEARATRAGLSPPDIPPVSMAAIGAGQCRYVVGDPAAPEQPLFCGAPVHAGSWCPWHRAMVSAAGPGEEAA